VNGLPPGAVLDPPPQMAQIPGLPPGAVLDPTPQVPAAAAAPQVADMRQNDSLYFSPLAIVGSDLGTFNTHIPIPGNLNEKLIRLGRGAEDIWQGGKQALLNIGDKITGSHEADKFTARVNDELANYEAGRAAEGNTGVDWIRGLGTAATPLSLIPGAGSTLGRTAALGALAGGTAGGLRYDEQNALGDRLKNTLTGAVIGAVAAPVAQLGTQAAIRGGQAVINAGRSTVGKISDMLGGRGATDIAEQAAGPAWAGLPQTAQNALAADARAQLSSGNLDPAMIERKANLLAQGVTPTKSMVTRTPADWTIERNLQKIPGVGDDLTAVYQANDKALAGKLTTMLQGLPQATQEGQAMTVLKGIDNLADATQAEVRAAYKAVSAAKGKDFGLQPASLLSVLDNLKGNAFADPLYRTITSRLDTLSPAPAEGGNFGRALSVDAAEELRKYVNSQPSYANGVNLGGFKKQIISAIDQDVLGSTGEDAFSGARLIASGRFKLLGNPAVQKALDNYGELTQGKTAQNFIQQQVVSAPIQDVKTLAASLAKIPDPAMRGTAQQALEAGTLAHFRDAFINQNSGQVSGAKLATALREFGGGSDEKLIAIVGRQKADQLKALSQAALDATYQPAHSSVNSANTAPTMVNFLSTMRKLPIAGKLSEWAVPQPLEESLTQNAYRHQLGGILNASAEVGQQNQLAQRKALAQMLTNVFRPGAAAAVSLNQARDSASQ
jgi:hypothetical protein